MDRSNSGFPKDTQLSFHQKLLRWRNFTRAEVQSDEEILNWIAKDAETALHPSCTCKLGTDKMSVLEPSSFKVHGMEGLRVVDASSMPKITNGNIYAPVMMMARKQVTSYLVTNLYLRRILLIISSTNPNLGRSLFPSFKIAF